MAKHKQMPGMTYKVITQDAQQAVLEYTYLCPYCMRKSTVRSSVYPPDYERLETGGFFDALACSECGKTADVRFWRTMKSTEKKEDIPDEKNDDFGSLHSGSIGQLHNRHS